MKTVLFREFSTIGLCLLISSCNGAEINSPPNTPDTVDSAPSSAPPADTLPEASGSFSEEEEQTVTDSEVLRIKEAYEDQLLAIDGVVGVGIQQNATGNEVIWVYLQDEAARSNVPSELEGVPVVTEVTGEFKVY